MVYDTKTNTLKKQFFFLFHRKLQFSVVFLLLFFRGIQASNYSLYETENLAAIDNIQILYIFHC